MGNKSPGTKGRSKRGSIYAVNEENIHNAYIIEETLGTGYYGTVRLGIPKTDTKRKFAIKIINKEKLTE